MKESRGKDREESGKERGRGGIYWTIYLGFTQPVEYFEEHP